MINLADKIVEKLEYKTQIHTAWNGSEQRMALRSEPRTFVSYDYIGAETWQSQYLRMLTFGQQTQRIQFPLWHAKCELEIKQYKGQANITIPTAALWGYRNIGSVMLWTNDRDGGVKYDIKYITANGVIGLTKQLTSDWEAFSTVVVPVFYGVLQQEDNYSNTHSNLSTMTINLELLQNQNAPAFPPAWDEFHVETTMRDTCPDRGLPDTYMGAEVFKDEPPWLDNIAANYSKNANRLDNETGVFRFDLKSYDTAETRQIKYMGISRAEGYNFQRFFMRCKGMLKSFYAPTWMNDLELAGDMPSGQIYLLVNFNMFWKYYAKSKRRRTIVIFYLNGTCEILKIAGYSIGDTGKYGKIYLENPLTHSLLKKQVAMISFFCRYRFGNDALTIDHDTLEISTMDLNFVEVDE